MQRIDARDVLEKRILLTFIEENFRFQNFAPDEEGREELAKKTTSDLHKILKRRVLEKQVNESYLDELVDDLKSTT